MQKTELIAFKKKEIKDILSALSLKIKEIEGKEYVLDDNKKIATCPECNKEITTKNLGNIAKGSNLLFCDNPACFVSHLAKQKV